MKRLLVSACLLGQPVRYDGQSKPVPDARLERWATEGRLVPFCPECAAGLPTPRPPAERQQTPQGARVVSVNGEDLSATFAVADGWSIGAHAGKQWIEGAGNDAFEYTDWKLGVTKSFENGFSVGLAYTGTDADDALYTNPFGNKVADDTVALTITKAF